MNKKVTRSSVWVVFTSLSDNWRFLQLLMFQFMRGDDTCKRTAELTTIGLELKMINCGWPVVAGISSPQTESNQRVIEPVSRLAKPYGTLRGHLWSRNACRAG